MNSPAILDRNLVALSTRHPDLARLLSSVPFRSDLKLVESREGSLVPALIREGRLFHLHSRFDPVSEGRRLAEGAPEGFIVGFGLGGAYHLTPLLERKTITGLLIVEKDAELIRGILESIDLTGLLGDSRVILLVDPEPEELNEYILERYIPVLYGNLGSITLRSRWDSEPEWFSSRAKALKGLPEDLGRDYTVQARFGRRWFVHTMANLPRTEETSVRLPSTRRLLITAAGPSLETQLPRIRDLQKTGATLLATDTSLPLLAGAGIVPNMVLSIDCQVVSYHHFMKGLPEETVLILDLASPPVLTRQTDRILFFSSGHPFSLYLNRLYRPFPILDLSGGNVTHAALSLAGAIGAEKVHLFGADFSYPEGRPYAGGTYLYPYFQSRSDRTECSENTFWKFISGSRPRREQTDSGWRLRTASMDHYRESLERYLRSVDFHIVPESSAGVAIDLPPIIQGRTTSGTNRFPRILSAGPINMPWQDFLRDYRHRLESLPPLSGPPQDYLAALGPEDRQAWATLLPSAATFRNDDSNGPEAVEDARKWTLDRIKKWESQWDLLGL